MGGEFLSAALTVVVVALIAGQHHFEVWKAGRVHRDAVRFFGQDLANQLRYEAISASLRRRSGAPAPSWRQDTEDALADAGNVPSVAAYQHAFSLVKRDAREGLVLGRDIQNHV